MYQLSPEDSDKDPEGGLARHSRCQKHCPRASPDPCSDPGLEHLEGERPQSLLLSPQEPEGQQGGAFLLASLLPLFEGRLPFPQPVL